MAERYLRARSGKTIHRPGCPHAGRALPWGWADDMPEHELRVRMLAYPWLKACSACLPGTVEEAVLKGVSRG